MYDWDLQVVPGPPKADLKRRVLEEWLYNPFLDDDTTTLALRLGAPSKELGAAVDSLCDTGFLRAVGSGYTLALDLGGMTSEAEVVLPGAGIPASEMAAVELAALSGAVVTDPVEYDEAESLDVLSIGERADSLTRDIDQTLNQLLPGLADGDLVEALPFGMIVLRPTGAREMANERAAEMLGVAYENLDGATFEMATGVNPLDVLDADATLTFSVTHPRPLEVNLHGRHMATGAVVLILLRDVSLLEEVSQIQAEVQELLYERMQEDMVDPLVMIEGFLEHPDVDGLVQARVAMEKINWFLQEFFLRGRLGDGG